ncbi:hypothetical protein J4Q44_G00293460 [Coregonus suidteri]|uniref:Uncharacterized protein n=1 Tax=Coregonus suidteri TaxID=861788 RepID=A0AAN8QKR9_9TELE
MKIRDNEGCGNEDQTEETPGMIGCGNEDLTAVLVLRSCGGVVEPANGWEEACGEQAPFYCQSGV